MKNQRPLITAYTDLCPIMDKLHDAYHKAKYEGEEVPAFEEIRRMIHEVTTRCSELLNDDPPQSAPFMDPLVLGAGVDNRRDRDRK